jgi:secreted trypsin-like serine protease
MARHFGLLVAMMLLSHPVAAIVNGAPASEPRFAAEFPWAVALVNAKSGGVCTGQLIAPSWVLTAAHCAGGGMQVVVGSADRTTGEQLTPAEAIRHPLYDPETGDFDIGLLRLPVPLAVAPVALLTPAEAGRLLREDAKAVIAGWGKRSPRLGHSERFIVSDVELRGLRLERGRIIYVDAASGPCGGDSGGPLLLTRPDGTRVLAGVASRVVGNLCAQGGGIGIYMNVAEMRGFINGHLAGRQEAR